MKAVDFYKLSRALQERFVGSVTTGFPPAPILSKKAGTPTKLMWLGISAASALLLVIVARVGYGSLDSSLAIQPKPLMVVYAALMFGVFFGLVQAFTLLIRERALPFATGIYVFPACVVDARSDSFKVHEAQDLVSVTPHGAGVALSFKSGARFEFAVAGRDPAQVVREIEAGRDRSLKAYETEDPKELVAVDPMHDPLFSSPVGPRDPYDIALPPWGKFGWAVAAGAGVVFGLTFFFLRDSGSDRTMFARATQANDAASYRAYLKRGKSSRDEVANFRLPRAELREAIKDGTVEALLRYRTEHPGSKIGEEVTVALRTAMLHELEKAKAPGTLAALHDFALRYPNHGIEPEYREAIHAVYARELDTYRKRSPGKDKNVVPFVERLFGWAEKRGPKVEIRFRRKKSESMGRADQLVGHHAYFIGEVSYPTKHFDDKRAAKREDVLAKTLMAKLDAGLSPELLDVELGPLVTDEALPETKVPTLFISYSVEWSGHVTPSPRPRGVFVGLTFPFEATFVIPGDPKPYKFKWDVLRLPMFAILKDEEGPLAPGVAEVKMYEAAATTAFEIFGDKFLGVFLPKDPAAK